MVVDLSMRVTISVLVSSAILIRWAAKMTVPTVTMAISTTIRLTLKAILKLLSHDMFGSVRLALTAARRATGELGHANAHFADLRVVFVNTARGAASRLISVVVGIRGH